MLSDDQFNFLVEFMKAGVDCKNNTDFLKFFNREKVSIDVLKDLFVKHPELYPACPFNENNPDDMLDGNALVTYFDEYLKKIGLNKCIEYLDSKYYGISSEGLNEMCVYKRDVKMLEYAKESNDIANESNLIAEKANEKSKTANIIAWIALGLSALSTLVTIATLIFTILK